MLTKTIVCNKAVDEEQARTKSICVPHSEMFREKLVFLQILNKIDGQFEEEDLISSSNDGAGCYRYSGKYYR